MQTQADNVNEGECARGSGVGKLTSYALSEARRLRGSEARSDQGRSGVTFATFLAGECLRTRQRATTDLRFEVETSKGVTWGHRAGITSRCSSHRLLRLYRETGTRINGKRTYAIVRVTKHDGCARSRLWSEKEHVSCPIRLARNRARVRPISILRSIRNPRSRIRLYVMIWLHRRPLPSTTFFLLLLLGTTDIVDV